MNPLIKANMFFALLILGAEIAVFLTPGMDYLHGKGYPIFHLSQMAALIFLTYLTHRKISESPEIRYLDRETWKRISFFIRLALVSSLAGDLINSELFYLGFIIEPQKLISILPFAFAHYLYIRAFILMTPEPDASGKPGHIAKKRIWITVILAPIAAVALWNAVISDHASQLIKILSFPYALIVSLMMLAAVQMPIVWKKEGMRIALGGWLFVISDSLIALYIIEPRSLIVTQTIWISYILAQILIASSLFLAVESDA